MANRAGIPFGVALADALTASLRAVVGGRSGGHQLEIRAPGYRPFAIDITVDGTTRESLLLDPIER